MFGKSIVAGVIGCLFFVGLAGAQQPPLTDKQVQSFIASFPEARRIGKKYDVDRAMSNQAQSGGPMSISDTLVRTLRSSGGYGEFNTMVRRHGFASPEAWAQVADRVMKAYVANSMGPERGQMNAQLQQALRQIEMNPSIPPQQKEAMLRQMRASAAMMKSMESNQADQAAVRPHMATLEAEFDKADSGPR